MTDLSITIRDISKRFGRFPALKGVDLDIRPGELLALLGPSGSGKTTLLRVIAGLEFPEGGAVLFDGEDVTFAGASDRGVGFVFQQYALFKHMTIAKNVAFGLDIRKRATRPSKADIAKRVDELLTLVELDGLAHRYPAQLSGGQRQRVALARALAVGPKVLLLDEPFGALDATVRKSLRRELRHIHDRTGITTIFVTHDQEEALELADRVAILNAGKIEQLGTPDEVHDAPVSAFVAGFVGEANRFDGEVSGGTFKAGAVSVPAPAVADGKAIAFIRPHHLVLSGDAPGLEVTVERVVVQGAVARIEAVASDGRRLDAAFSRNEAAGLAQGAKLRLKVNEAHVYAA